MFLFFGIMPIQRQLNYNFSGICARCGEVNKYDVLLTGSSFSIFFIPLFTFGKRYLVRVNCCNNIYILNSEIGKKIANGEAVAIKETDLTPFQGNFDEVKRCGTCGYEVEKDFYHCPKCGTKL